MAIDNEVMRPFDLGVMPQGTSYRNAKVHWSCVVRQFRDMKQDQDYLNETNSSVDPNTCTRKLQEAIPRDELLALVPCDPLDLI
jgi:hypothetical protein